MRKSKAETTETRRRIVDAAARRLIATGIEGTGLNDLMADAGLTRGGFYRHFESKDQLVAEACTAGLQSTIRRSAEAGASLPPAEAYSALVGAYLSPAHRDNRAGGCPFAGLGSELARSGGKTRETAGRGFERLISALEVHLSDRTPEEARKEAVFALSAMVGALTMARMVDDPALSDAILNETRKRLVDA
jgi:TetR/AcrR family transcriptional regulator, transcriptional repressor for nem operon